MPAPTTVGVIVNPWAGKDVRRLHAAVGHTPDTAKIGIVRRVALGALDAGAQQVVVARDVGRIAERAVRGIDGAVLLDGPGTGSALDTRRAATQLAELGCGVVVVLGGDGTCRDVAIGSPDVTMIAISTGTNNVFPGFVDGTSAGCAAGLIATGAVEAGAVACRAKRLVVTIESPGDPDVEEIALVDVAVVDASTTGARAVTHPHTIRAVVAAISSPTSTGMSSIAGRTLPLGRSDDGAVVVVLGTGDVGDVTLRRVRVPIVPGGFAELAVERVSTLTERERVRFDGPCVLAYDGERDRVLPAGATATVQIDRRGPVLVDVDRTLRCAAARHLFDVPTILEVDDGD